MLARASLGTDDDDDEDEASEAAVVEPSKKARTPSIEADAVGNGKCSSLTLASCFARLGAQEQKLLFSRC